MVIDFLWSFWFGVLLLKPSCWKSWIAELNVIRILRFLWEEDMICNGNVIGRSFKEFLFLCLHFLDCLVSLFDILYFVFSFAYASRHTFKASSRVLLVFNHFSFELDHSWSSSSWNSLHFTQKIFTISSIWILRFTVASRSVFGLTNFAVICYPWWFCLSFVLFLLVLDFIVIIMRILRCFSVLQLSFRAEGCVFLITFNGCTVTLVDGTDKPGEQFGLLVE